MSVSSTKMISILTGGFIGIPFPGQQAVQAREHEQGEQQRREQAAHDHGGKRALDVAADSGGAGGGHHSEHGDKNQHQTGTQLRFRTEDDGVFQRSAGLSSTAVDLRYI